MAFQKKNWWTVRDLAREACVTPQGAHKWVRQHGLGLKRGGKLLIDPDLAQRFLDSVTVDFRRPQDRA